ncbi:MAG: N-acetyltransferase family protein [Paracoccaceae bacterium]
MTLSVRALSPDDQEQWRAVRLEALESEPAAFLTTAAEQRARSTEEDRAQLAHGNWRGLFRYADLIGLAALIPMPRAACQHRMEVGAVYVSADHRGGGVAQFLLDALVEEARDRGALQLELFVADVNPRAIRFYERNGFVRCGSVPRAVSLNGQYVDDFFYVRFLDRPAGS